MSDPRAVSAEAVNTPGHGMSIGLLNTRPWAAVALLTLIGAINYLDRTLPMILAESLKTDFGLSDTAIGLMNGLAFTFVYALAGIPIARIADRGRYGMVISSSLGFWSLMTALGSIATSGLMLAFTRLGVAVGEAGNTPAAHAFVSRKFEPRRRAAALGVLTTANAFGTMFGMVGGGLLAESLGWRGTMLVMGVIGMVLAPVALVLLGKGETLPGHRPSSIRELLGHLGKRSIIAMMIAFCFMSMAAYSLGAFSPAFLMRAHGMSVGQAGFQLGLLNGFIGIAALLGTGWLATRLTARDPRWTLGILLLLILATVPIAITAFLPRSCNSSGLTAVLVGLCYGVTASYMALTVAPLHSLVPVGMRAQGSAMLLLCSGMIGGLGPLITGMISDAWTPTFGPQALGIGLLLVPVCLVLAALAYTAAMLHLPRDLEKMAASVEPGA